jgi:hypothetical protein
VPFLSSDLKVTFFSSSSNSMPIVTFFFTKRVLIKEDIGVMGESVNNITNKVLKQPNKPVEVLLSGLKTNNSLIDVFDRIVTALQVLVNTERGELKALIEESLEKVQTQYKFRRPTDPITNLDHSVTIEEIVEGGYDLQLKEVFEEPEARYDCYVMMTEIKALTHWMKCKILRKIENGDYLV